ncbi:MAG: PAS domain S-box protein [Polyangiaceae bacterium]|nr:PAS domain S-box protein [Polyangiaceae bacterium]
MTSQSTPDDENAELEPRVATLHPTLTDVLEGTHDLIQATDAEGRFLFVNRAWRESLGFTESDLPSLRVFEIVAPESQSEWEARVREVESVGRSGPFELALLAKNGERLTVEGTSIGARDDAKLVAVQSFFRDVTRRNEAERSQHRFVGTLLRDMRQPLTMIRGALSLLNDMEMPSEAKEIVNVARHQTGELLRQLQDTLDLQQMRTQKPKIRAEGVSTSEICRAAVEQVKGRASQRGVALTCETPPTASIRADREMATQALQNLVAHAVKSTLPGGEVVVAVEDCGPARVRFFVKDEGPRLGPADIVKLFHGAEQRSSSESGPRSTVRLSLAVVKAIVEAHDGTMGVNPRTRRGNTYWFELPAYDPSLGPTSQRL